MEKRYIICSAIKYNDHIIHGRRHGDAFQTLERFLSKEEYSKITRDNIVCGFVDQWGDFWTRTEAWTIAEDAGQIKFGKGLQESEIKINFGDGKWEYKGKPQLISEHLFPEKD